MNFFVIPALLFVGLVTVSGCPSKFKSSVEEEYMNATTSCLAKLSLTSSDLPTTEDMNRNADMDDKCMSKCMLERFEVVDKDGNLDRDVFFDFLEENAPKPLLTKLTEIVNKCADSTEIDKLDKSKETTQSPEAIPCQKYHAFHACFTVNADKLC